MTNEYIDRIRLLHKNGDIEILKAAAMESIQDIRAGRVRKENNEETLWNLAESIGGEKHLLNFFNRLYDLSNAER